MSTRLAPLSEEPINDENTTKNNANNSSFKKAGQSWRVWIKNQFPLIFNKKSDLKILLSVMGCPLSPISTNPKQTLNNVATRAQYIIQHFVAATGCKKLEGVVKSVYAIGNVKMVMTEEAGGLSGSASTSSGVPQHGCFVVWQMIPDKWLIELVVSGHKIIAGSNGNVAWRHTPWLGAHAAKGGVRPLRRALQAMVPDPSGPSFGTSIGGFGSGTARIRGYPWGLDPVAVAAVFSAAQFMGEKRIDDEDCFALKLSADQTVLADRSDSTAEIIKHVMIGYFSQRSGLLVYLEDSHLTRIQSPGSHPTYWETTMGSSIKDYRTVDDGVMIAHSGHSTVSLTRFGNNVKVGPLVKRMEETWTIDDIVFNVPGLSIDCFIPPEEVRSDHLIGNHDLKSSLL
ncbi:Protein of unknown function DUF620 [Macleaya cordata]|uniref:Lipase n=1 Tax=Macleaya cordata TaxID=56857 RepID=A0A200Q7A3_MACCD|nr:Protein of unknown function DUF620 [Macleaya cordata]